MITLRKETDEVVTPTLLPRVNLLPVEIREAARLRQVQAGLGLAVVGAVAAVGLLYAGAAHSVGDAQDRLSAATSTRAGLQKQVDGLADVTRAYARTTAARQMLVQAMGSEVRYSQVLDELASTLPDGVWLTAAQYKPAAGATATTATTATTSTAPATAGATTGTTTGATTGATTGTTTAAPSAGDVGTVTLSGHAYTHDDVAALVERLAARPTLTAVQLSSSTEGLIGSRVVTTWSLTAQLTPAARSGRYPAGG